MKGKKLIFVFVGLILVVAGVLCIFLWPKNNEKEIYTNALKKSLGIDLGEVKETVTSEENLKKVQHTIIEGSVKTPDGTFTVKDDVYAMVGKAYMNLIASDGEKNINGVMLLENTRLYFTIKDYLQKYYYYDLDSMTDVVETNEVDFDYEKLLNIIKNDFYDSIDEKNIKTESVTKEINSKEYKAKKYSYTFTGQEIYNFISKVANDIKADKDLLNQLNKSFFGSNNQISLEELLDSAVQDLTAVKDYKDLLTYTVFMVGDEVISTEATVNIPVSMGGETSSIPVIIVINNVEDYYQAYLTAMGMRMYEFVVDKTKGYIGVLIGGAEYVTGTISDNKITIKNSPRLETNFSISAEKDDANNTVKVELTFEDFSATLTVKEEEVAEFPNVDVSGAVPYTEAEGEDKTVLESLFPSKNYIEGIEVPSL